MSRLRRHAVRAAVVAVAVLAVVAGARAAASKEDPKVSLSKRLATAVVKLRTTHRQEERALLREEIEGIKHQLGPTDAAGRRITCEAMWHDVALRDLEQVLARAGRIRPAPGSATASRLRLALQQMAAVALTRGWADEEGSAKYRFDAVGMAVYTHLGDLEGLLTRAAGHLTAAGRPVFPPAGAAEPASPPPASGSDAAEGAGAAAADAENAGDDASANQAEGGGPAPPGYWSRDEGSRTEAAPAADAAGAPAPFEPAAEAAGQPPEYEAPASPPADGRAQALAIVQDGVSRLVAAAGRAHAASAAAEAGRSEQDTALVAFIDAISDVHRATAALDAAGPTGPVVLPAEEQPGLTEADGAAIREAEAHLAAIESPSWKEIRDDLASLLATAGEGLKLPRTRREARRLLQVVSQTAEYIQGLLASRMALPDHVTDRQEQITEALAYLKKREYREGQYRRLLRIAGSDSLRRILDASDLSPEAGQGLQRLLSTPRSAFPGKEGGNARAYFLEDVQATIRAVGQAKGDPPAGLDPHFASLRAQTGRALREAAAELGANPPADPALLRQRVAETAAYASDLGRLERAGRVVHTARSMMGERAEAFCNAIQKRVEKFVLAPSKEHREDRRAFDLYLSSVDGLARLRLPDKSQTAVAMRLSGGAYRSAAGRFGENLTRNFASAADGRPEYLEATLDAASMFTLLRHRAIAETTGLADVDPASLDPFAFPPKPWKAYVTALDRRLVALLKSYGAVRGWSRGAAIALGQWDEVYSTVVAAQHVTREAGAGETPLAALVARLERMAEPRLEPEVWIGWATGYHTLEAAACLMGDYPTTAYEHLHRLSYVRRNQYVPHRLTWRVFDPPE